MSKVEVYYFTGTGNSLHIARELQNRLPGTALIPMVSLMDKEEIKTDADTIGFVFPIYMAAVPIPVKNFIKKLKLKADQYVFAIATRIGVTHGAFEAIDRLLKKKGKRLDSYFSINMPSNDPKFNYVVPTTEVIAKLEAEVHSRLDNILQILENKKTSREKDNTYTAKFPFVNLLSRMVALTDGLKVNLYADSKCIGCGTCERVCPARKVKMVGGRPLWEEKVRCYHCAACLNFCPMQAAQIKSYTEKNGRYSHPYATVEDIAAQKNAAN